MKVQEWLAGVASLGPKEYYAREGLAFKIPLSPEAKTCNFLSAVVGEEKGIYQQYLQNSG
jgi:hypothetical protein